MRDVGALSWEKMAAWATLHGSPTTLLDNKEVSASRWQTVSELSQGQDGRAVGFNTVTLAARRGGPLIGTSAKYCASRGVVALKKQGQLVDGASITVFLVEC